MNKPFEQEIVYKLVKTNIENRYSEICYKDKDKPNRYWFKFPENWTTSTVNERIIGFRSLWIPLAQRILTYNLECILTKTEGEECITYCTDIPFLIYLNVNHHFEDIIKDMLKQIQEHIDKNIEEWKSKELPCLALDMLNIRYETKNRLKCFIISSNEDKVEDKGFSLIFKLYNLNDDAKAIFNTNDMDGYDEIIECEGIWTRHRCLLRSSISINNSKNYLGYSQNNYNPIKYYKIQCSDPRFYIDLLDAHDEEAIVTLPNDCKEGMCLEIVIPDTTNN
jgi:hypothetical protein